MTGGTNAGKTLPLKASSSSLNSQNQVGNLPCISTLKTLGPCRSPVLRDLARLALGTEDIHNLNVSCSQQYCTFISIILYPREYLINDSYLVSIGNVIISERHSFHFDSNRFFVLPREDGKATLMLFSCALTHMFLISAAAWRLSM